MFKKLAVLACFALAGCVSSGVQIDQDKLSKVERGHSTKTEVLKLFGKPNSSSITDTGSTIGYMYTHAQVKAASFIPIVGMFAGGATSEHQMVIIVFDKADVVTSYTVTDGNADVTTKGI